MLTPGEIKSWLPCLRGGAGYLRGCRSPLMESFMPRARALSASGVAAHRSLMPGKRISWVVSSRAG
eukprot:3742173-Heterocapsa_arctica.AAC.1